MRLKKPIKLAGGKNFLAPWIIGQFPPRDAYTTYLENFAGGASVLLAHNPEGKSEILNELDGGLSTFWKVLQSKNLYPEFVRRVSLTPFSQVEFERARLFDDHHDLLAKRGEGEADPVDRAVAYFVKARQSMMGMGKGFAPISTSRTRGGMNEQVSAWLSAVEGLPLVHERLKRVLILAEDGIDLITKFDKPGVLQVMDPPYFPSERTENLYREETPTGKHSRLVWRLLRVKNAFVCLSGYHCPLYAELEKAGWRRVDKEIDNKMSKKAVKPKKVESLWMNY